MTQPPLPVGIGPDGHLVDGQREGAEALIRFADHLRDVDRDRIAHALDIIAPPEETTP